MNRYFRLNDSDNVAVVLFDAQPGDKLDFEGLHVTVTEPVPYGHKVALCDFHTGISYTSTATRLAGVSVTRRRVDGCTFIILSVAEGMPKNEYIFCICTCQRQIWDPQSCGGNQCHGQQ